MATYVPHRFQEGTNYRQARPLLDDNFDKVVSDINDLGAKQSSTTSFSTGSIAAGAAFRQTVAICNPTKTSSYSYVTLTSPINGVSAIVPAIDVYVDTNNDSAYLYPLGISLSTAQKALAIDAKLDLTSADSNIASITVSGRNYDASAHTYYITIKVNYFPAATSGTFR